MDLDDSDVEHEYGGSKRARHEAPAPSDTALDAETAWALGFTPTTITTEEEEVLPADGDEGIYTRVLCCNSLQGLHDALHG